MGRWGHFSESGDEYIITRPDTPRPWINYLTNGTYCAITSHTGGGYSFIGDPGYNRITREHPGDEIYEDRPGRYLYVHEVGTKNIWSLNWQPVQAPLQAFEARVGLGYTKIAAKTYDLASEVTYFVPRADNLEFWMVNLKNEAKKKRTFRIYSYVEWTLGNFPADLLDRSFENLFNRTWFDKHILFATKTHWNHSGEGVKPWDKSAFMTMNIPVDGYEALREKFLGEYRYLNAPEMVVKGEMPHHVHESGDAIGVLCTDITLAAGESANFDVILGAVYEQNQAHALRQKYATRSAIESAFSDLKKYWADYHHHLIVKTPDKQFNTSVNIWNRYQCWLTSQWSEMDSYYIPGSGTFGFRDEAQHIFGLLPHEPDTVREKLRDLLIHQFKSGMVVHNWDTYSKKGKVTYHSDDVQWLVKAILNYLKETGDLAYLDQRVPYYDGDEGTIYDHLIGGINYTLSHLSNRGIPLRMNGDWNDALAGSSQEGQGESVMIAGQVGWNILELIPVLEARGESALADKYREQYHRIADAVNKQAWDGRWYIRGTTDTGKPIGSHTNDEGSIFLNAQSWMILSQMADIDRESNHGKRTPFARGLKSFDAVWKHLMTPYGPAIFLPPYTATNLNLGVIAQFTPGTKENGTIFLHPVAWSVIAECLLGRGDNAFEIWRRSSFMTRGQDSRYKSEPYVYPEYMYGPAHPKFGQGSYTWITGSAAWFYRASTDWILGIRPTLAGLQVDPCVPKTWASWQIERDFRGARYVFEFENPHHVHRGVLEMTVDDKIITGNRLPDFRDGKTHLVKIILEAKLAKKISPTKQLAKS